MHSYRNAYRSRWCISIGSFGGNGPLGPHRTGRPFAWSMGPFKVHPRPTTYTNVGKSSIYVRFNKTSCLRQFLGVFLTVSVLIQNQPNSTLSQQSWSNRPRARPQRGLVSNHAVHHDLFSADQSRRCNKVYTIGYKCIFFYGTSSGLGSSVLLIVFIR